jgi:hypothetical protein
MMVTPALFFKKLAGVFRRKVSIDFTDCSFLFKIEKNDIVYKENAYELKEIESYSPQIVAQRFVVVKFFLKKGDIVEYSFIIDDQVNADEILHEFNDQILAYNKLATEDKINVRPSFFASSVGLFAIYGLIILFIIAVIVNAVKQFKTFPITLFMAVAIIIQLIIRRNAELKFYNKYKDMLFTPFL